MEHEWERLQKLYEGLSDGELLKLADSKGELTEVAQQAVDAEVSARGLAVPELEGKFGANAKTSGGQGAEDPWLSPRAKSAVPEGEDDRSEAEKDPSLVELMTFNIATEAEKALHELDDDGIPVTMEPAMRRLTEDGPRIKTNWLTLFVEKTRQKDAEAVLRKTMGLFPVLAADEVHQENDAVEDDTPLPVGTFEVKADAEIAQKALSDAGIWFSPIAETVLSDNGSEWEVTRIEVRAKDLDHALSVVEAAFGEEA